jgi:hypothetical protein
MDIIKLLLALALAFPVNAVSFSSVSYAGSNQTSPDNLLNDSQKGSKAMEGTSGLDCECCKIKKTGKKGKKGKKQ